MNAADEVICRRCGRHIDIYDGYESLFEDHPPVKVLDVGRNAHVVTCYDCGFAQTVRPGEQ